MMSLPCGFSSQSLVPPSLGGMSASVERAVKGRISEN
jgi:hypothetical protein